MIRFRGVLLKPLDQQADRDGDRIDPAGVEFDPEREYAIFVDFNYLKPPLGHGRISRDPDGSLVVSGEMDDFINVRKEEAPPLTFAIGVALDSADRHDDIIHRCSVMSAIGVTAKHADPTQPPISFEEV